MNKKRKKEEDKRRAKGKDRTMFSSFSFSIYLGEADCQGAARIYTQSRGKPERPHPPLTALDNSKKNSTQSPLFPFQAPWP